MSDSEPPAALCKLPPIPQSIPLQPVITTTVSENGPEDKPVTTTTPTPTTTTTSDDRKQRKRTRNASTKRASKNARRTPQRRSNTHKPRPTPDADSMERAMELQARRSADKRVAVRRQERLEQQGGPERGWGSGEVESKSGNGGSVSGGSGGNGSGGNGSGGRPKRGHSGNAKQAHPSVAKQAGPGRPRTAKKTGKREKRAFVRRKTPKRSPEPTFTFNANPSMDALGARDSMNVSAKAHVPGFEELRGRTARRRYLCLGACVLVFIWAVAVLGVSGHAVDEELGQSAPAVFYGGLVYACCAVVVVLPLGVFAVTGLHYKWLLWWVVACALVGAFVVGTGVVAASTGSDQLTDAWQDLSASEQAQWGTYFAFEDAMNDHLSNNALCLFGLAVCLGLCLALGAWLRRKIFDFRKEVKLIMARNVAYEQRMAARMEEATAAADTEIDIDNTHSLGHQGGLPSKWSDAVQSYATESVEVVSNGDELDHAGAVDVIRNALMHTDTAADGEQVPVVPFGAVPGQEESGGVVGNALMHTGHDGQEEASVVPFGAVGETVAGRDVFANNRFYQDARDASSSDPEGLAGGMGSSDGFVNDTIGGGGGGGGSGVGGVIPNMITSPSHTRPTILPTLTDLDSDNNNNNNNNNKNHNQNTSASLPMLAGGVRAAQQEALEHELRVQRL